MEKCPAKIDNGKIDYSPNLKMETFSEKNLNNSLFENRPIKIDFANCKIKFWIIEQSKVNLCFILFLWEVDIK